MSSFESANKELMRQILEQLGIESPSKEQLSTIKELLSGIEFDIRLTPREQSCLYWSARGKTSEEIAEMLNLQKQTIDSYKKRIFIKLGCKNIAQSIFEGMRTGCLKRDCQ